MRLRKTMTVLFSAGIAAGALAPVATAQSSLNGDFFDGGRGSSVSQDAKLPEGSAIGSIGGKPLTQVDSVDTEKYVGDWYQVAAIPQPYTIQCASNTKAKYGVLDDSTISVKNTCDTLFGTPSEITGKARITDADTKASLRVAFDRVPGQNLQGTPNYVVTYLSEDYDLAIIGDPQRLSGFVLSRTPNLTADQWKTVKNTVKERGWWDCAFVTTPQKGGERGAIPVCAK